MIKEKAAIAVLKTHSEAESVIKELQVSGFDMKKLSIVGKDYLTEEQVVGYYNAGDRMGYWGKQGAFWGALWGALFGSAFFLIPGIGPLLIAGPLVATLVGALEGAAVVGGMSALGAALYSIGIPNDSIVTFETAIKSEHFVLIVHGTADDIHKASNILNTMGHDVEVYPAKEAEKNSLTEQNV
jgi:hypothetical protein